ncbi:MAG: GreA/GreB family elongation factor [Spirochaetes bacterium]|nr:GreA/GreB family elongation factor [Spirochaetota bacterium]MBU1079473.1 GreA/GreB family elongation factor [Spirochaetota bacterium]
MNDTCILLGLPDYKKLSGVVAAMKAKRRSLELHMRRLDNELETADVVDEIDLPDDVVSIGSTASIIDLGTGERFSFRLVFPAELDGTAATASVFSPLGVAVIGERAGSTVSCMAPSGEKRFAVESVAAQAG